MTKPNGIIKLHGREYKTVALRVQEFREKHGIDEGWALITKPVEITAEVVVFRAAIVDPQGREIAVGFAEEKRSNRGINASSALENCETSALGRALAAAGYGGSEYASADELVSALSQQGKKASTGSPAAANTPPPSTDVHPSWPKDYPAFFAELEKRGLKYEPVAGYCQNRKWGRPAEWPTRERTRFLEDLDAGTFKDLFDPARQQAS